ncbi:Dimeric alpha-beta barrel [Metarhizium robertsii ARSEF 23]|uniref:Dimeric alpha-beta barrel n=1 Tax=Metarhizium robertsii (strain ARSEF 23 / ATCC MYA-3075) TaxID=655844 RepID=E9F4C2_METRA|nr:Dimeric alpha-beta barrel [Metarhizium robertsii ARSEF 23]EFY97479.2 Dimeric alpha-beta barrel [Metarhizium robertsii ARSEF 23]
MVLVHIVLFKFKPSVSPAHKEAFAAELKRLRDLPSVLNKRLVVGGPSVTDPIARSRGNHLALVSYHASKAALAEYQASDEHHRQGGMADSTLGMVS